MNILNKVKQYISEYGIKFTFNKIIKRIMNETINKKSKKFEQMEQKEEFEKYKLWIKNNEPDEIELNTQRKYKFEKSPKISIIVPMYNTKEIFFKELVESLKSQTYSNWELCLADGSNKKLEYIDKIINKDDRIKYIFLNHNGGISENTNEALKLATGDYIALLDHDDVLPAFSLYEIVDVINKNKDVDYIYTDEDKIINNVSNRMDPHFKPDFAPDTLMSYNYICHFSIIKKELISKIGGFKAEFDGSQDYDFIFRATENAKKIIHIPKILYHWRIHEDSVASSCIAKPYAYRMAIKAIEEHLRRKNICNAKVKDSLIKGIYKVEYDVIGSPKVSIIILNKNHKKDLKKCINSIRKSTYHNYEIIIVENNSNKSDIFKYYKRLQKKSDIKIIKVNEEFNYSKFNNIATKCASGEFCIFLNNDIKIITKNWIESLVGNCQREDVGVVGAKLLYSNKKIQHGGIVLNLGGIAGHINLMESKNKLGYMCRNVIQQNFSAITGALMIIKKDLFIKIGGFDENFPVAYNDVDLCLKILQEGKLVVYNSCVEAYHYESKTRGYDLNDEKAKRLKEDSERLKNKWKNYFEKSDKYFNVNFRKDILSFKINSNKID